MAYGKFCKLKEILIPICRHFFVTINSIWFFFLYSRVAVTNRNSFKLPPCIVHCMHKSTIFSSA